MRKKKSDLVQENDRKPKTIVGIVEILFFPIDEMYI